jgi:hypothetical protein
MSLGIVIKGPEGVVLACDSRVTLTAQQEGQPPILVNFDNATKLLSFVQPHNYFGCVVYGVAVIGLRTAHSFVPELQRELDKRSRRLTTIEYARIVSNFYLEQWKKVMPSDYAGIPMVFIMGGYDEGDAYSKVFLFNIPFAPEPIEQNPGEGNFGMTWGGQLDIVSRLVHGFDPRLAGVLKAEFNLADDQLKTLIDKLQSILEISIPFQILPLQDCVNLAHYLIQTTINGQNVSIGIRGVGGPIDVATITRSDGLVYITKKTIRL